MLRDKVHGAHILEVRKALAFAGFTHKSPPAMDYVRVPLEKIYQENNNGGIEMEMDLRGRTRVRETGTMGRGRAISM